MHFDAESIIDRYKSHRKLADDENSLYFAFGLRILSNLLLCSILRGSYFGKLVGISSSSKKLVNESLDIIKQIDDFNHNTFDEDLYQFRFL